jgi:hypothetical protein
LYFSSSDYVKITEKGIYGATSRHCGFDPLTYITFGNIIQLQFKSDDSSEYKGFEFTIKSVKSNNLICFDNIYVSIIKSRYFTFNKLNLIFSF